MIVTVIWVVENNLVYFAQKRRLICDCDSFWAIENNLVYLREDRSDCDKFLPGGHIVVIFL